MTHDIEALDAHEVHIRPGGRRLLISLEGIDAKDLFDQMPDGLVDELILLAGAERCVRVMKGDAA